VCIKSVIDWAYSFESSDLEKSHKVITRDYNNKPIINH
jgi:hypothetical protein